MNFHVIWRLRIRIYIIIQLYVSTVLTYTVKTIRMAPYLVACRMQQVSTVSTYGIPWIMEKLLFPHTSFARKVSLIFPIIDLRSNLHIGLSDLVNPLFFANSCPEWHNYSLWGLLFQFHGQLAIEFLWVKMWFGFLYWQPTLEIILLLLDWPCPNQFTC